MSHRISPIVLPLLLLILVLPNMIQAQTPQSPVPPVATVVPHALEMHGQQRIDPYYWLNEREDPEVIAYLEAENEYAQRMMEPTEPLQEELYQEITGRIDPDDASVPYELNGYWYYTRFTAGDDYRIYCRKKGTLQAPEEVMIDGNELGKDQEFFSLSGVTVSSDCQMVAFGMDTVGRRKYDVHFKDLQSGELLPHIIEDVSANMVWAEGSRVLFYTRQDPETLREFQIWRHEVGAGKADVLVYEEKDDTYSIQISKSKSREFLLIEAEQTLATEYLILPASDPLAEWKVFEPRERDHEYQLDHVGGRFLIRTNWKALNFRIMETSELGRENWRDVVASREDTLVEWFEGYDAFVVIRERREGLQHLVVMPRDGEAFEVEFADPTYSLYFGTNVEPSSTTLRFIYTSMTTPESTYDYEMLTRTQQLMKREKVMGGFTPENYESKYLWATARDGARVPISIVYRKDLLQRGKNPLLLYSYGSYGSSSRASFSSSRLSLLDRGFVWATAHIRGGQELGRQWYEDGKLLEKINTFTDFIDCGRFLDEEKWCDGDRIYAYGGSAGGLLVGAAMNMAPELFDGVVARVPFVDVVTTMLDESIPLTTSEYDEWGDPRIEKYYDYMLSYSPYDQIEMKDYPNLLVTAGLHDSQVQYFEPAKWVAKLRAMKTNDSLLLLQTNMEAGHGGASGRFSREKETAFIYAFVLTLVGIADGSF